MIGLGATRERRAYPHDEGVKLRHVVSQELGGRFIRDLAVVGNEALREPDVGLGRVHLRRVAEAQDAAQMLLRDRRAYRTSGARYTRACASLRLIEAFAKL